MCEQTFKETVKKPHRGTGSGIWKTAGYIYQLVELKFSLCHIHREKLL